MRWPLTLYTRRWLKEGQAGIAIGPVIVVDPAPKYRDDAGLHAHELEHVRQWALVAMTCWGPAVFLMLQTTPLGVAGGSIVGGLWSLGFFLHNLLYRIPEYRLWSELAAYRVQAGHYFPDNRLPRFARYIAMRYGLPITEESALEALRDLDV